MGEKGLLKGDLTRKYALHQNILMELPFLDLSWASLLKR
jgi:hypothetical protein